MVRNRQRPTATDSDRHRWPSAILRHCPQSIHNPGIGNRSLDIVADSVDIGSRPSHAGPASIMKGPTMFGILFTTALVIFGVLLIGSD